MYINAYDGNDLTKIKKSSQLSWGIAGANFSRILIKINIDS